MAIESESELSVESASRMHPPQVEYRSRSQIVWLVGMHVAAVTALVLGGSALDWTVLLVGHILTAGVGLTLGFHRMLSHRAIDLAPPLDRIAAFLGVLSFQGGPLRWVALHRAHHKRGDGPGDPHSAKRGFWWSHIGWVYHLAPNGFRFRGYRQQVADLNRFEWLMWFEDHFLAVNLGSFIIGVVVLGPVGALWAFPLRIVAVWHTTWLVNSVAHGVYPFRPASEARPVNSTWLSLITYGEGLHANHHRRPAAASFAGRRGEFDVGYALFRCFEGIGLASRRRGIPERLSVFGDEAALKS